MRRILATFAVSTFIATSAFGQATPSDHWVATWATAVVARPAVLPPPAPTAAPPPPNAPAPPPPAITPNNQTLREIVRTSVGGARARVMFANTFGTTAVNIGGASIALRDKESAIVAASVRTLTLNGRPAFRIPAGAVVLTDAVDLQVPARADVAIDVFVPDDLGAGSSLITFHNGANQRATPRRPAITSERPTSRAAPSRGRGSCCPASRSPPRRASVRSRRLAIRLPMERGRRPIPTTAGPITWHAGSARDSPS